MNISRLFIFVFLFLITSITCFSQSRQKDYSNLYISAFQGINLSNPKFETIPYYFLFRVDRNTGKWKIKRQNRSRTRYFDEKKRVFSFMYYRYDLGPSIQDFNFNSNQPSVQEQYKLFKVSVGSRFFSAYVSNVGFYLNHLISAKYSKIFEEVNFAFTYPVSNKEFQFSYDLEIGSLVNINDKFSIVFFSQLEFLAFHYSTTTFLNPNVAKKLRDENDYGFIILPHISSTLLNIGLRFQI